MDDCVVAVEGGWQISVGGAAGATVRKADVLATCSCEWRTTSTTAKVDQSGWLA
jgi:NAD(P)H-nitrite reductase large subunit